MNIKEGKIKMKRQTQTRRRRKEESAAATSIATIIIIALAVIAAVFYYQLETTVAGDVFSSGSFHSSHYNREFTLVADDFGYNGTEGGPTLIVKKGDMVKITLIGKSPISHNLIIDEFNFRVGGEFGITSGETDTGEFMAVEAGVYKYYCRTTRLGGHESLGQVGILIVE